MAQKFDATQLSNFIGAERYYRLYPHAVLTDGTKYLADAAGAYWRQSAFDLG